VTGEISDGSVVTLDVRDGRLSFDAKELV
jgi:hypothetical protein